MSERGWVVNNKCQFCDQNESIHHLFFPVLQPDLCGVVSQNQLGLRIDLGIFPSSFGGFLILCLPVGMFRF
jgi:hypothetical protein